MRNLYHYTSLETLALIVYNKTICFNNLLNVDDIEEAETEDMDKFGRFLYTSCWTDDDEESIPLWNLYTPNMHGVRIRLPEFPFKKYYYKQGEFFLSQDIETYIHIEKFYNENKLSIVADGPQLVKIEYTNDKNKLYPRVRNESIDGVLQEYLNAQSLESLRNKNFEVSYSFRDLGKFKRENWKFQKEWRYIISAAPMGLQECNPPSLEKQQELIRRLENKTLEPPCRQIFLDIAETALENMEVVFGPKMSEAEKIMAKGIMHQYCPKSKYRESSLRIK